MRWRLKPLLGEARARLPILRPTRVVRGLILRANAARDGQRWPVAAALYEEALRLAPSARLHKQCGHMFKEAGQYSQAEHHYRAAERLDPSDADLVLQIGHFEKLRGDPIAATSAYTRALELLPQWREALEALRELPTSTAGEATPEESVGLVAELLPSAPVVATFRELIRVKRLGHLMLVDGDYRRTLSGIEAVHGQIVAKASLDRIVVKVDGVAIAQRALEARSLAGGLHKHVFNLWIDFSTVPVGSALIELAFQQNDRLVRSHRATADIRPPRSERDFPASDGVVDSPPRAGEDVRAWVDARPSVRRESATALRNAAPHPSEVRNLLVQRIDQLGDLIVTVPALDRLRLLFPHAHIVLLASPANGALARTIAAVDEVLVVDVLTQADGRRAVPREAQLALKAALAERNFDLAIDLSQGAESRALLKLADARFTYGFRTSSAPWLSASFDFHAPDAVDGLETCSPARKLLAMIDALDRLIRPIAPAAPQAAVAERSPQLPRGPYAVLHAGARIEGSRWPFFGKLAELLLRETTLDVLVFGDRASMPIEAGERLSVYEGMVPFDLFDAMVRHCSVFVGNDSGPKHLAAFRAVPTVSLHLARLNWSEWGQEGPGTIISRRVPCAGCAIDRDPDDCGVEFACLRQIRPEEVFAEILKLLSSTAILGASA